MTSRAVVMWDGSALSVANGCTFMILQGGGDGRDGGGQTAEMRRQQEQTFSNKYLKFSRFPSRPLPPGNSLIDVLLASANE